MANGRLTYVLPTHSRKWFHFLEVVLFAVRLNNDRLGDKTIRYINKVFNPMFCGDLKNVKDIDTYLKSPNLNIMSAPYLYPTNNKDEDEPYLISRGYSYTAEVTSDFLFYETGLRLSDKQFYKLFAKRNFFKMIAVYFRLLFDCVFDNEYNTKFEWKYEDLDKFKDLTAVCPFNNNLGPNQYNYPIQTVDKLHKHVVYDRYYFYNYNMLVTGEDIFYFTELFLLSEKEFVKKYGEEVLLKYQGTKNPMDPISEAINDGYVENIKLFIKIIEYNYTEFECYLITVLSKEYLRKIPIDFIIPTLFKYVSIHGDKVKKDLLGPSENLNQEFFTRVYGIYKRIMRAKNKMAKYYLAILERKVL